MDMAESIARWWMPRHAPQAVAGFRYQLGLTVPILLRLPPHRFTCRVLYLDPVRRAPGDVARVLALRDDAFEAEPAGVLEYTVAPSCSTPPIALLKTRPGTQAFSRSRSRSALRFSSGSRRRSSPCSSIRSKAYRNARPSRRRYRS